MAAGLEGLFVRMTDGFALVGGIISFPVPRSAALRIAFRRNEAFPIPANEILPTSQTQRFSHQRMILRVAELHQCALHGLVL